MKGVKEGGATMVLLGMGWWVERKTWSTVDAILLGLRICML